MKKMIQITSEMTNLFFEYALFKYGNKLNRI
jgi:hypothetical protein